MIGAVIYYGKNTLVAELPMGTMDLQLEEYFDFSAYGGDIQDEYDGKFVSNGYVYMEGSMSLENILDEAQDMDME